jgi:hypothetical protein
MKRLTAIFVVLALASGSAFAHGRGGARVTFGFNFGYPIGYNYVHPWYYYPAPAVVYAAPPVVYASPPAPQVYTERSDVVPESAGTWYYCQDSRAYYPYVRECPGGWQRVPAQPR